MKQLFVALALILALATPVAANPTLTAMVNSAWVPRQVTPTLTQIAQARAIAISTDFSHNGAPAGLAEVIAWIAGYPDPLARIVDQWQGSALHNAILSNSAYRSIGCATHVVAGVTFAACILSWDGQAPQPAPAPTRAPTVATPLNPTGGLQLSSEPATMGNDQPSVVLPDTAVFP